MAASECLDDALVARLADDDVSGSERLQILAHADGCDDCRELLVAIVGYSAEDSQLRSAEHIDIVGEETILATQGEARVRVRPQPGDIIDHYTVVDVLAMGPWGWWCRPGTRSWGATWRSSC